MGWKGNHTRWETTTTTSTVPMITTLTSFLTVGYESDTFEVGMLTTTLTIPETSVFSSGITTDTSLPPSQATSTTTSTSSSSAPTSVATYTTSSGPSAGQLVGIIVGSVAGGCFVLILTFLLCWRRRRRNITRRKNISEKPGTDTHIRQETTRNAPILPSQQLSPTDVDPNRRQSFWRRSINPADIGVAVISTERQGFVKKTKSPRPRSRSYLPISAPVPVERVSMQENFSERFFRPPRRNTSVADDSTRHGSDATTIRTSGNPPTPNRPTITLLRLYSSITSKRTSVEDEEKHSENDEVPPLPTIFATGGLKSSREEAIRRDLEAGIKTNLSKATSRFPLTYTEDNSDSNIWNKPTPLSIPRSQLAIPKRKPVAGTDQSRPAALNDARNIIPTRLKTKFPDLSATQSPYTVPERQSSRSGTTDAMNEKELLPESQGLFSRPVWGRPSQPAPAPKKLSEPPSPVSPLRSSQYAEVHTSTSDAQFSAQRSSSVSPVDTQQESKYVPPATSSKYTRPLLPPLVVPEDPLEGPSNYDRREKQQSPPKGLSMPAGVPDSPTPRASRNFSSSQATLTPNRTPTGDLFLTVDMLNYVVYD